MKWLQYLTPVKSIDTDEAEAMMNAHPGEELTILDVRQPGEYLKEHIPGAVLIPLPKLKDQLDHIDSEKPVLVY